MAGVHGQLHALGRFVQKELTDIVELASGDGHRESNSYGSSPVSMGAPCVETMHAPGSFKGRGSSGTLRFRVTEETDLLGSSFAIRRIPPLVMQCWLLLQVTGLFLLLRVRNEVAEHLRLYDALLAQECSPERSRHGLCLGSSFTLAFWSEVPLSGSGGYTLNFTTTSHPPTFLIDVAVAPTGSLSGEDELALILDDFEWQLFVQRTSPSQQRSFRKFWLGSQKTFTFEDLSAEAEAAIASEGRVEWTATLTSKGPQDEENKFTIYVEDATSIRMPKLHSNKQCAFIKSWEAFNQQHNSYGHRALSRCSGVLTLLFATGCLAVFVESTAAWKFPRLANSLRFHIVVVLKFILQDMPQQIAMVMYLLGWYEADGLRCQLCLFRSDLCTAGHALNFVNMASLLVTLLSSLSNQCLIRPISTKPDDTCPECTLCWQGSFRVGLVCVLVLPFTTCMAYASRSILPMAWLFHLLFTIPCCIGWAVIMSLASLPLVACYIWIVSFCEGDSPKAPSDAGYLNRCG